MTTGSPHLNRERGIAVERVENPANIGRTTYPPALHLENAIAGQQTERRAEAAHFDLGDG